MKVLRLTKQEAVALKDRQKADGTAAELLIEQAQERLAAIDPDLPASVRMAKAQRIKEEARAKVGPLLYAMQQRAEVAEGQREHYTRTALLRRAGTEAPPKYHALCATLADGVLAQVAEDAFTDGDRGLAGAAALAAASRTLDAETQQAIAASLGGLEWPEVKDLNDRLFQPIRDAYCEIGVALARFAPPAGGGAIEIMTCARDMGKPVLTDA